MALYLLPRFMIMRYRIIRLKNFIENFIQDIQPFRVFDDEAELLYFSQHSDANENHGIADKYLKPYLDRCVDDVFASDGAIVIYVKPY